MHGAAFALEQLLLALHPPAVARKMTIAAYHAVTGNRHGQAIGAARLGHGAKGAGRADALGNLGIAGSAALRNVAQRLPDTLLERGAAQVQGQVQAQGGRFDKTHHLGNQLFKTGVGAD